MDPLSVGASVIAFVGATGKLVKGIRRLKAIQDAPQELDDLLNEVSQFELVVQASQRVNGNIESDLGSLLKTAQGLVTEFESLIEYKLTEPGTSNRVDRWQWIRSSKDVERLRVKLRDVTASLVALVGVNTGLSMDQVSQNQNQILSEQRQYSNEVLSAIAHLVQLVEESPSTQASLTSSLGNFRQLTLEPPPIANGTGVLMTRGKVPQCTVYTCVPHVSKAPKATICTVFCACNCHKFRRIGPPRILSSVFGHGYVMIAGSFFRKTQCNTVLCKAQAALRVSVQYRLPQWLAARMIFMWLTSCPPYSPELLLRVPRVVDHENSAFKAVYSDGFQSFELAIRKGDCTPDDVDEDGFTLLSWLMQLLQGRYLLHLSTYREYWNPSIVTPEDKRKIWTSVINNDAWFGTRTEVLLRKFSLLIDFEDYIEEQNFTRLHQIVCGLSNVPLDVALQVSTDIDTLDCEGRSALWYAVTHRRHDCVSNLLERGADPNIGKPPFLSAVAYPCSFAITKALLDYGANFDSFKKSFGIYQWAMIGGPDALAIDELLVKHGLDPNHRGDGGETILMALHFNYRGDVGPRRLKHLLRLGCDTEITDERGLTAVMYAVCFGSPSSFGILARAGARVDVKSTNGSTVLHLAIWRYHWYPEFSNELCEVMRDADLTKLDLDAKDEDGHRAFDLLRTRNGPDWEGYCAHNGIVWYHRSNGENLENELKAISALENLLHYVQEVQGVPEADRYPPLGEYCSRIIEEEPVPGAWPMY